MSAPDDSDPAGKPDYDPVEQSPQTLGQLERWFDHAERRRKDHNLQLPSGLGRDAVRAIDQLRAYSGAKYGEPGPWLLSIANIRRLISQYALDYGVSMDEAAATPLQVVADFLAPRRRNDAEPEAQPSVRSGKSQRKAQKAAKKTRKRIPRTVTLILVLLEQDRTKANLNMTELAVELRVHVSSVSRAFRHKTYGPTLANRYYALGAQPPKIREV